MRLHLTFLWLLMLGSFTAEAAETPSQLPRKTICLNMIVKNESRVIERCLESVKNIGIDYWVIVDTGSDDGTQKIIQNVMKDIPGELYERPWVNFGYNRTEALNLAKNRADYLLFIDADEIAEIETPLDKCSLTCDGYLIPVRISDDVNISLQRAFLVSTALDWSWKNVLHERLTTPQETEILHPLPGMAISAMSKDGNRSQDPQKYLKDAHLLEKALEKEPDNADYVYYLAQSYFNTGRYDLALKNYEKRAGMKGWDQATFWSQYYVGVLQQQLGFPSESFIHAYCKAFQLRPTRAEPLYRLANYFYCTNNFILSYAAAEIARHIPVPNDLIYIEYWIYNHALPFVFANSAFLMGKYEEAEITYRQLLAIQDLPLEYQEKVTQNLQRLKDVKNALQ
ncbi:MAG: glycosyltransferase [Parachlamydiaceae bacterium]